MKVAVISNREGRTGSTSFCLLLACVFARTQRKKAVICSNVDISDIYEQCNINTDYKDLRAPSVYKALLSSAALDDSELTDYADRIGDEEAYCFNLFSEKDDEETIDSLFRLTMNRCRADLTLVGVKGDLNGAFNKEILEACDVILYVCNTDATSRRQIRQYITEFDSDCVMKTGFICMRYNQAVIAEKRFARDIGIALNNIMFIPECMAVVKAGYNGELDKAALKIVQGSSDTLPLRLKFLEVMQYLFDSKTVRYIKGIEQW